MDKDLLRIVIITLGILVMIGMILWSFFRDNRSRRKFDFYDEGDPLENVDNSLVVNTDNDDFDVVPLGNAVDDQNDPLYQQQLDETVPNYEDELFSNPIDDAIGFANAEDAKDFTSNDFPDQVQEPEYTKAVQVPEIIQIHVLALDYDGFSGKELLKAFQLAELEYGSMKIFEKLDENRRVKFSVASMVEPGTFPDTGAELKVFKCPGIVFFLQPGQLENPLIVFDEFMKTIDLVASKLEGVKLDSKREPLSKDTIAQFRKALSM